MKTDAASPNIVKVSKRKLLIFGVITSCAAMSTGVWAAVASDQSTARHSSHLGREVAPVGPLAASPDSPPDGDDDHKSSEPPESSSDDKDHKSSEPPESPESPESPEPSSDG